MDTVISFLVLSTLPQLVSAEIPSAMRFRAAVEVVQEGSRIFTGESLRLRCSVPDDHRSKWDYLWFRGGERVAQSGSELSLWNAQVKEGGKYSCQGVRNSLIGDIHTLKSLPVEVTVDGGFAILHGPPRPGLVGHNLTMTCRVRRDPPVTEKILYKDGIEVLRQNGPEPHFHLQEVTLEDAGMYSCRASWDVRGRTYSAISAATYVQILEVLSQPVLEFETNMPGKIEMKLTCHVQYNSPPPAPPVHFYFYRNNVQLATAASENHEVVKQTPGQYSCKARVPVLGLSRRSEPKMFGPEAEPPIVLPPRPDPNQQRRPDPTAPSPENSPSPAARPVTAELAPTSPAYNPYTEERGEMAEASWNFSEESENISKQPGDISEECEDIDEGYGDFSEGSGDFSEGSGDFSEGSGDYSEESGDFSEESEDFSEESGDYSEESGDFF